MPLGSDDEYTDLGTVNSLDPRYRPSASFKRNPYRERKGRPAQEPLSTDGYGQSRGGEPRRERTSSQRGVSPSASQQSRHTQSTVRPLPPKSHHSNGSIQSYSTARKDSFPVEGTRQTCREESSVYSQDPVQPPPRRKTMSEYSAYKRTQPGYGNNPPPNDPFGLSMNMGALALDDRSDHSAARSSRHGRSEHSAAPSSRHGQGRGLVPRNDLQDRMPLANPTQQSMHDQAGQNYERRQAIRDALDPLTRAADEYIDPRYAIEARGARVIARERTIEKIMGREPHGGAIYGAPPIDFSQRSAPRSGLPSTSASSNNDNQYPQPQLAAPRNPGFIEAGPVRDDDDFSVGSHGTSSRHSRHDSVSYDRAPPPRRAIMPSAGQQSRNSRNVGYDQPLPPRTRPPPSHTGSRQSETTRSGYSKHSSRAGRSRRSSRREEQDEYDSD